MLNRKKKNYNNNPSTTSIDKEFRSLCKPKIDKLWKLLEVNNSTGERRAVTHRLLRQEVLPVCITKNDTFLIRKWIQHLETQQAESGRELPDPIKRKSFYSRIHKDMFAPLLLGVVKESEIHNLNATFEGVICSVERNRRWSKLKDRFATKIDDPDTTKSQRLKTNVPQCMQQKETHQSLTSSRSSSSSGSTSHNVHFNQDRNHTDRNNPTTTTTKVRDQETKTSTTTTNSNNNKTHHRHHQHYPNSSSSSPPPSPPFGFKLRRNGWSDLTDWKQLRRNRHKLHKCADHLNSLVRVWSYDPLVKRARTITAHTGDHIQTASIHGNKLVALLSNGKVEESVIHLTLLSKSKASEISKHPKSLQRYNSMSSLIQKKGILTVDGEEYHHGNDNDLFSEMYNEEEHQQHHQHDLDNELHRSNSSHTSRSLKHAKSTTNVFAETDPRTDPSFSDRNTNKSVIGSPSGHVMSPDQKERRRLLGRQYPERNGLGVAIGKLYFCQRVFTSFYYFHFELPVLYTFLTFIIYITFFFIFFFDRKKVTYGNMMCWMSVLLIRKHV